VTGGADPVISADAPPPDDTAKVLDATRSMIAGLQKAGVKRFLMAGGAGSLRLPSGGQLVDAPGLPPVFEAIALAHRNALGVLRQADRDWTSFSPAASIEPVERTGKFRSGTDDLMTTRTGTAAFLRRITPKPWPTNGRIPTTAGSASPSAIDAHLIILLTFPRGGSSNR